MTFCFFLISRRPKKKKRVSLQHHRYRESSKNFESIRNLTLKENHPAPWRRKTVQRQRPRGLTTGRAAHCSQSEPSIRTHLQLAFSAAIFEDTLYNGSAHTIEWFLPGAVERGKEDGGYSRSLEEMCTGLSKDCIAHILPNFPDVTHCKVIRCGLTYPYGWAMNNCDELFGQVARKLLGYPLQ